MSQSTGEVVTLESFLSDRFYPAIAGLGITDDKIIYRFLDLFQAMCFEGDTGTQLVNLADVSNALRNYALALEEGDHTYLFYQRGMRVDRIIEVDEFVCSRDYLDLKQSVRPRVLEELYNFFHGPGSDSFIEAALCGSIGWGKTFFSLCGMAYLLYQLSCYYCPQLEYKMAPGTNIIFSMQSVKFEQARKVLFDQFTSMLYNSPYFTEHFCFDPTVTTELRFPNNIYVMPLSASDTASLGHNIFAAVLDELNFMARIEESAKNRYSSDDEYDQASRLYVTALKRLKSRFMVAGKIPGRLFLISSSNYPGDFMDRKCEEAAAQVRDGSTPTIFVVKMAQWEAFPAGRFSDETFLVEVGDATKRSRIIESIEHAVNPEDVISVPVDYLDDFKRDLEGAIRDLAGVPIGSSKAFISQRENIYELGEAHKARYAGIQLFTREVVDLTSLGPDGLDILVNNEYLENDLNKSDFYAIHVDMSLTGDSCGIAVSHFDGWQEVGEVSNWDPNRGGYTRVTKGLFPKVVTDGVIEVIPPASEEIDIGLVGDLVIRVIVRLPVRWVTADRFQSAALLQRVRKIKNLQGQRIKSSYLSVDTSITPYAELKQAIRDRRIVYPPNDKLRRELSELQLNHRKMKVDHPPNGGSKDLADAVCGSMFVVIKAGPGRLTKLRTPGVGSSEESTNTAPVASARRRRGKKRLRIMRM